MAGYQVMPRMNPERYAALEADIITNGVQEPIKVSEGGVIVDGHHRDEIARKHDLHCPRIVIKGDDAYLRDRAYTLNGARRDLTPEERRALVEKSLRSDPILRDSDHARRTGMDRKTVKRIRMDRGIPTPDDVIREYTEEHPEKSNREVAADLGVSHPTVAEIRGGKKRDIPEYYHPTPECEPTAMVGTNETTPEWEDVGTIPQSRLKDIARPTATTIPQSELDELNTPSPLVDPGEKIPETSHTTKDIPETEEPTPRAEPITTQLSKAIIELNKAMNRIHRIVEDPNFHRNKQTAWSLHGNDIIRTIDELETIVNNMK